MKDKGVRRSGFGDGRRKFKVKGIDDDGVGNNGGVNIVERGVLGIFVRECVHRSHTRAWGDHPFNVKVLEKKSPASLTMREFLRILYI